MLIRLSDGCYVATDQIAEVKVNEYANSITVRTKDGIGHSLTPGYKQSVWQALDDLVKKINAEIPNREPDRQ